MTALKEWEWCRRHMWWVLHSGAKAGNSTKVQRGEICLSLSSDGEAKEMDVERRISIGPVAMEARKGIHQYEQQQQQQQHHHHHHHHHHHDHNSHGGALDSSDGGVICVACVTFIDMCRLAIFAIRLLRLSSEWADPGICLSVSSFFQLIQHDSTCKYSKKCIEKWRCIANVSSFCWII